MTEAKEYVLPKGGRRIVGYVSLAGMLLSVVGVIYGANINADFVPMLVLVFICALCMSHAWFAFASNLTQRRVRKIDYWYLGAAAVGMFMFAIGYSEQRGIAITKTKEFIYRQGEMLIQGEVTRVLVPYINETCKDGFKNVTERPCTTSVEIAEGMTPGLSPESVERYLKRLYSAKSELRKHADDPAFEKMHNAVGISLIALKQFIVKNTPKAQFAPVDEGMRVWFGVGQMVIWPFLLAFALALRITKVTIDVFGWVD